MNFKKSEKIFSLILISISFVFTGCARQVDITVPLPAPEIVVEKYTPTALQTSTSAPTLTATINPLITLVPTQTPSPTPDPFANFFIDALAARKYGGGVLEDMGELSDSSIAFNRRLFRYRSEGLNMYGFINIPVGEGPLPVIFMFHGYVDPKEYSTLDYSTRYADALAEKGFIVLHPNLRGYSPSPAAENSLGIGDTIDALNLIALVRQQAGAEGLLKTADVNNIGLWGHSMGGGIVMRILVIDKKINAALLYASVNASEEVNLSFFEEDGRGNPKPAATSAELKMLSPLDYLGRETAPISIHYGEKDTVVPPQWAVSLCGTLTKLGKTVECIAYPDQPHTFQNSGDTKFIANSTHFFEENLKKSEK
jgi:dienelactone hydrolase